MSTNTFSLTDYVSSDNIVSIEKGSDGANQRSLFENSIAIAHAESPQSHCEPIARRKARRTMDEQREREQRGLVIAATAKMQKSDDGRWFVPSQTGHREPITLLGRTRQSPSVAAQTLKRDNSDASTSMQSRSSPNANTRTTARQRPSPKHSPSRKPIGRNGPLTTRPR